MSRSIYTILFLGIGAIALISGVRSIGGMLGSGQAQGPFGEPYLREDQPFHFWRIVTVDGLKVLVGAVFAVTGILIGLGLVEAD